MWQNIKSCTMQYKHTRLLHALEILFSAFFLLDALLPKNTEIFYRGCGMSDLASPRFVDTVADFSTFISVAIAFSGVDVNHGDAHRTRHCLGD